jgi:hypothetical protein
VGVPGAISQVFRFSVFEEPKMRRSAAALALLLFPSTFGPAFADEGGETLAEAAAARPSSCIFASDRFTWRADNGGRVIYVRSRMSDYYRLDIGGGCSGLGYGGTRLRARHGRSNICSPRDWEVTIASGGRPQRCMVTRMTALTPAEVAAIPRKFRP